MRKISIVITALVLSSCASQQPLQERTTQIQLGMTQQQVKEALGIPQDRQFKANNEAWQYCENGFKSNTYLIVWMKSGLVTGQETYTYVKQGLLTHAQAFLKQCSGILLLMHQLKSVKGDI